MFTGIVQATGRVLTKEPRGDGARITIDAGELSVDDVTIGESIAVAGCCLTVVAREDRRLAFDISAETLSCTTGFDSGRAVNLERALRLSDRLGGHLLAGHVDGVGTVVRFAPVSGGSRLLEAEAPAELARFIASKGSIAIDGVSMTVNEVAGRRFGVNVIPITQRETNLGRLAVGERVNLEIDMMARYVARLMAKDGE